MTRAVPEKHKINFYWKLVLSLVKVAMSPGFCLTSGTRTVRRMYHLFCDQITEGVFLLKKANTCGTK